MIEPLLRLATASLLLGLAGCAAPPGWPEPRRLWPDHAGGARDLCFDAAGELLATAGADGYVRLWRTRDGAPLGKVQAPRSAALADQVERAALRAQEEHGLEPEELDRSELLPWTRGLVAVAVAPAGDRLALVVADSGSFRVVVHELPSRRLVWRHIMELSSVEGAVYVYDVARGTSLGALQGDAPRRRSIPDPEAFFAHTDAQAAFSADGSLLVVGPRRLAGTWRTSLDPSRATESPFPARTGELTTGRGPWRPEPPAPGVLATRDTPRGDVQITLRPGDGHLIVRAGETTRDLGPQPAPPSWRAVALSPCGRWLALGDRRGGLRLWSLPDP